MSAGLVDALKSALRVWVFTTLGLWIPGLLGWVAEVSSWASQKGAPPFPDPTNVAFLFVAALTAAFPAAVAGIWRLVENASGHTVLPRAAGPQAVPLTGRDERGSANGDLLVRLVVVVVVILVVVWLLRVLLGGA